MSTPEERAANLESYAHALNREIKDLRSALAAAQTENERLTTELETTRAISIDAVAKLDDVRAELAAEREKREKAEHKARLMLDFYAALCAIMNFSDGVYNGDRRETWAELKTGQILGPAYDAIQADNARLKAEAEREKGAGDESDT